ILKGWFDRVLVSGVCYGGKRFYDQGGLAGKKALVSLTLGGRQTACWTAMAYRCSPAKPSARAPPVTSASAWCWAPNRCAKPVGA
ncbi:NAD(P)H-dependent oxidoreductase, partial [Pseudomonas aeruginosa]|uniref:NAD(P)H-dependent oxidoreductase n=1 Tax=Pseudomonas aeruginosa TaxID=287 RepID=UPI0021AB5321